MESKVKIGIGVIILVVIIGSFFLFGGSTNTENMDMTANQNPATVSSGNSASLESLNPQASTTKTFVVDSHDMRFFIGSVESPDIVVNKGDKVIIEFSVSQGTHDFKLDEFNVATQKFTSSGKQTVEFVADKTGTFEYYCSVGQHRANGMKGKFIVN